MLHYTSIITATLLLLSSTAVAGKPNKRVIFVGDSITAGLHIDTMDRYPEVVGQLTRIDSINAGCAGSTTRDWNPNANRGFCVFGGAWPVLVSPNLPADSMFIMLGTNDANGFFEFWPNTGENGFYVSPEEYFGRLFDMVDAFPGTTFLITPLPPSLFSPYGVKRWAEYKKKILRIVDIHPRACLGLDTDGLLDRSTDYADLIHPNENGMYKIAMELSHVVEDHIIKNKPCKRKK